MNRLQRWTLIGGLLLIFLAGLFPPTTRVFTQNGGKWYETAGRCYLIAPRLKSTLPSIHMGHERRSYLRIDYYRLGVEWVTVTALTAAVFLLARKRGAA